MKFYTYSGKDVQTYINAQSWLSSLLQDWNNSLSFVMQMDMKMSKSYLKKTRGTRRGILCRQDEKYLHGNKLTSQADKWKRASISQSQSNVMPTQLTGDKRASQRDLYVCLIGPLNILSYCEWNTLLFIGLRDSWLWLTGYCIVANIATFFTGDVDTAVPKRVFHSTVSGHHWTLHTQLLYAY